MPDPERETHIEEDDARAGSNEGVVRWVLAISLGLAIAGLTIIWVTGALTQGDVESEGTTRGRAQEQLDEADQDRDTDGLNPDVGDRF